MRPLFSSVSLAETTALDVFTAAAHEALKNSIFEFKYPDAIRRRSGKVLWKDHISEIRLANKEVLSCIDKKAGVYAIFVAGPSEDWDLKYIGQTASSGSTSRICSHLVWRNKETRSGRYTGSKFDEIQAEVARKRDVAISFVEIYPATLRQYVESFLIQKKQPDWNLQGVALATKRRRSGRCVL